MMSGCSSKPTLSGNSRHTRLRMTRQLLAPYECGFGPKRAAACLGGIVGGPLRTRGVWPGEFVAAPVPQSWTEGLVSVDSAKSSETMSSGHPVAALTSASVKSVTEKAALSNVGASIPATVPGSFLRQPRTFMVRTAWTQVVSGMISRLFSDLGQRILFNHP